MTHTVDRLLVRAAELLDREMQARRPGYVPRWRPRLGSPGAAITRSLADGLALLQRRLEDLPEEYRLAFLEMLGTERLVAQPARAPLVFELQPGVPTNHRLPRGTRVAAQPPPVPGEAARPPLMFATEQEIILTRGRLTSVVAYDPRTDEKADHTQHLGTGFTLFGDLEPVEHELYLGHHLFELEGSFSIVLSLELGARTAIDMDELGLRWDYHTKGGWLPLEVSEDITNGLTHGGTIRLARSCGPAAAPLEIGATKAFWIRARTTVPLSPRLAGGTQRTPQLDRIQVGVGHGRKGLAPDAAFFDAFTVDTSKQFYPFGRQPTAGTYPTFYLASNRAFGMAGAEIELVFHLLPPSPAPLPPTVTVGKPEEPVIVWEYLHAGRWRSLVPFRLRDGTDAFRAASDSSVTTTVCFTAPDAWDEGEVHGTKSRWIRARLESGAYGNEPLVVGTNPPTIYRDMAPPRFAAMTLGYELMTAPAPIEQCLSSNAGQLRDHTRACREAQRPFDPFLPLEDSHPSLVLGFDAKLPAGLCSIAVHVGREGVGVAEGLGPSPFQWEYWGPRGWTSLTVLDRTNGFQQTNVLQWVGPPDAMPRDGHGGSSYRVRARLRPGIEPPVRPLGGLWHNAVWGIQRSRVEAEILGRADGNPFQCFVVGQPPILENESLWVREWVGEGPGWELVVHDAAEDASEVVRDRASQRPSEVWIRWERRPHLHQSGAEDRHYVVEPGEGRIRFGDGARGRIPTGDSLVRISYLTGGGQQGNVPEHRIVEPHAGIPFLQRVFNPIPATGGADVEAVTRARMRGPARLRHRNRAMAAIDYAWLAREASPAVAHARCLPVTGPAGAAQPGFVTVVVVPFGDDPRPTPSEELLERVRHAIVERCPATAAAGVRVVGPRYRPVSIQAEIVPESVEGAAVLEAAIRQALTDFLHPVHGGVDGLGWGFGEGVPLSRVAARLAQVPGLSHTIRLSMRVDLGVQRDVAAIEPDCVVCSGEHDLHVLIETS